MPKFSLLPTFCVETMSSLESSFEYKTIDEIVDDYSEEDIKKCAYKLGIPSKKIENLDINSLVEEFFLPRKKYFRIENILEHPLAASDDLTIKIVNMMNTFFTVLEGLGDEESITVLKNMNIMADNRTSLSTSMSTSSEETKSTSTVLDIGDRLNLYSSLYHFCINLRNHKFGVDMTSTVVNEHTEEKTSFQQYLGWIMTNTISWCLQSLQCVGGEVGTFEQLKKLVDSEMLDAEKILTSILCPLFIHGSLLGNPVIDSFISMLHKDVSDAKSELAIIESVALVISMLLKSDPKIKSTEKMIIPWKLTASAPDVLGTAGVEQQRYRLFTLTAQEYVDELLVLIAQAPPSLEAAPISL